VRLTRPPSNPACLKLPEMAVAALAVIEDLDVVEDLGPQFDLRGPGAAVDELCFEGREEALGDGVVEAVALGAHRLRDPGGPGLLAEGQRHELAALIGVPDQPGCRPALGERHLQSIGDELGAHVIGHRPAHDPARVEVLDADSEVGDVGDPAAVRGAGGEVAVHKRVERLMRQAGLSGLIAKKKGRTTIRVAGVRVAEDLGADLVLDDGEKLGPRCAATP
jgi:hypothetical protein